MTGLVRRNGSSSNTVGSIHRLTQIDGLIQRVIVIGESSSYRDYLYIENTIIMKHLLCDLLPGHSVAKGYLRILLKTTFQCSLNNPSGKSNSYKQNPNW